MSVCSVTAKGCLELDCYVGGCQQGGQLLHPCEICQGYNVDEAGRCRDCPARQAARPAQDPASCEA